MGRVARESMGRRNLSKILAPAVAAAGAAATTFWLVRDPTATAIAAGLGAMAGVMAIAKPEHGLPPPPGQILPPPDPPAPPPQTNDLVQQAGIGIMLFEHLPMGVILIDRRGQVPFINPVAREFFGMFRPGGFHMSAFRTPRLLNALEVALEENEAQIMRFTLSRAKDTYLKAHILPLNALGADATPARAADLPAVLVVIEDYTQAHRAEELHRDFVANASHELKTPLSSISASIDTLNGHARDDPAATDFVLTLMAQQAGRMKGLLEDLLSLNRIELNERVRPSEPQQIRRVVWETAEAFRGIAQTAGMSLDIDAPANEPYVAGDREELGQVFANLIENAVRYGKPGKEVRIRCIMDDPGHPRHVGVAVEDDGPGIAREHLPRLTERFYRVSAARSRASGGTGLGLAIVKHIMNRHRGTLEIESEVGRGSRFTVWLPVIAAPSETESDADAPNRAATAAE